MLIKKNIPAAILMISSIVMLAGCAGTGAPSGSGSSSSASAQQSAAAGSGSASTNQATASRPVAKRPPLGNPAVIAFDPAGADLNDEARAGMPELVAAAKQAKSVLITGYCDKQQPNAKKLALARANTIKKELIENGISAKGIRVRYVTDQSGDMALIDLKGK